MEVVELVPAGSKMRTGYDIRRKWREHFSQGRTPASLDQVAAWLNQAADFPYTTVLDPGGEEEVDLGAFKAKAMPVLRRGPNGRWERCQMLLATYHTGPVAVVATVRA